MSDATTHTHALETKIRREKAGAGYLEIHTKTINGEKLLEAFTLASLAEVLDMPMSTMEGRYARGKLHYWKVDIPNGSGRPSRGFHYAQLADVMNIITNPGAAVKFSPNGDTVTKPGRLDSVMPLIPTYHLNKPFYTISALADHFGFSPTTIRNKLRRAGLMKRLENLGSSVHGGRPTRAIPESALGDVKLAVVDGATFMSDVDRLMANRAGAREQAKSYMSSQIAPHTPPLADTMRAWDSTLLAPVNAVKPRTQSSGYDAEAVGRELVEELEAIMGAKSHDQATTPPMPTDRQPTLTIPTPPEEDAEPEPHDPEVAKAAWDFQVNEMSKQDDEPTAEEYRDTAYILQLSKADAVRFVAEVKAARGAK